MRVEATHMTIPISPDRTRRGSLRLRLPKVSRSVLLSTLTVAVLLAGWAVDNENISITKSVMATRIYALTIMQILGVRT
jgi:hypothetical protein